MHDNKSKISLVFIVSLAVEAGFVYARHGVALNLEIGLIGAAVLLAAFVVSSAIQVADQWDKMVILPLGVHSQTRR